MKRERERENFRSPSRRRRRRVIAVVRIRRRRPWSCRLARTATRRGAAKVRGQWRDVARGALRAGPRPRLERLRCRACDGVGNRALRLLLALCGRRKEGSVIRRHGRWSGARRRRLARRSPGRSGLRLRGGRPLVLVVRRIRVLALRPVLCIGVVAARRSARRVCVIGRVLVGAPVLRRLVVVAVWGVRRR